MSLAIQHGFLEVVLLFFFLLVCEILSLVCPPKIFFENLHIDIQYFIVQKAVESGNIIFGYSTYTMFIDALQDALAGKEIVVLSNNHEARSGHKTVHTPEEAVEYLRGKGMEEIIVGGGVQTYNAFLDKDLVTDIYFNVTPMVIGDGGTIGSKDDLFVKFDKMNYEPIIENVIRLHLSK